jgi:hypothetical protein
MMTRTQRVSVFFASPALSRNGFPGQYLLGCHASHTDLGPSRRGCRRYRHDGRVPEIRLALQNTASGAEFTAYAPC